MPSTAAWRGWQEFRVARRAFEDRSRSQCSFYLEPIDGSALPPFLPGQFLTFSLTVADSEAPQGASRAITRCYSLSDRPDPAHYRVTIKRVPPPSDRPDVPAGASSNHFHDHVHQGDVLKVKAPAGHFVIEYPTTRGADCRRHRNHADDEHVALDRGRTVRSHRASFLRRAQRRRARLQGATGTTRRAASQRALECRLQPTGGRRPGRSRLPACDSHRRSGPSTLRRRNGTCTQRRDARPSTRSTCAATACRPACGDAFFYDTAG